MGNKGSSDLRLNKGRQKMRSSIFIHCVIRKRFVLVYGVLHNLVPVGILFPPWDLLNQIPAERFKQRLGLLEILKILRYLTKKYWIPSKMTSYWILKFWPLRIFSPKNSPPISFSYKNCRTKKSWVPLRIFEFLQRRI